MIKCLFKALANGLARIYKLYWLFTFKGACLYKNKTLKKSDLLTHLITFSNLFFGKQLLRHIYGGGQMIQF